MHAGVQSWVRDLNHLYRDTPALHGGDVDPGGFEWIAHEDEEASVLAWERWLPGSAEVVVVVAHMTPAARDGYRIGVPCGGDWRVLLHSDDSRYGGSGRSVPAVVEADDHAIHGRDHSITIDLPPLGVVFLAPSA